MTRPPRPKPAQPAASAVEEHRAEVVLFDTTIDADTRLSVVPGASHPHALTRGGQAAALYLWGLRTPDAETAAWVAQRWALNTASRAFAGLSARWDNVDWLLVRYPHLKALQGVAAARYAPATANRIVGAVRSVLEEAYRSGLYDREELERCKMLEGVRGSRLPPGRLLDLEEIEQLFEACSLDTVRAARNGALFGCLYGCGLRRVESARLLFEKVDLAKAALSVIGKGNKERAVPFLPRTVECFRRWVSLRGTMPGPFLASVLRWRRIARVPSEGPKESWPPRPLRSGGIWEIVWQAAHELQMPLFSPHDLRRTYITHLLDSGADVVAVSKLVGHSDPRTTQLYDRRPIERLREIVAGLPFGDG